MWRRPGSSQEDAARYLAPGARMTAYVERGWLEGIRSAVLTRYALPPETFMDLGDAGMHVSTRPVVPSARHRIADLPDALASAGAALRVTGDLVALGEARRSTLHVSGIRLRNARHA